MEISYQSLASQLRNFSCRKKYAAEVTITSALCKVSSPPHTRKSSRLINIKGIKRVIHGNQSKLIISCRVPVSKKGMVFCSNSLGVV
jgi:hypothetical protein